MIRLLCLFIFSVGFIYIAINKATNKKILEHLKKQEKMIDLMADEILILDIKRANYVKDKPRIWETEKGIKQYFEKKAEEVE